MKMLTTEEMQRYMAAKRAKVFPGDGRCTVHVWPEGQPKAAWWRFGGAKPSIISGPTELAAVTEAEALFPARA